MVLARFSPYAPTALFALLIFYFAVNALTGDRGLLTDRRRDSMLAARTLELQQLRAERVGLETRAPRPRAAATTRAGTNSSAGTARCC